ncbi:hypothetical protein MIMGU_mgv1a019604mg [Erythranthe guttata]|uniref:Uncharacterized protein n=1 Tax=Erythranthe guttata TaxID=4155 RepID=A0A022QSJ8_ERYGU|nr:hypothetical protein MIMGU_mgv1a019604mg [Erythranthe guttata]
MYCLTHPPLSNLPTARERGFFRNLGLSQGGRNLPKIKEIWRQSPPSPCRGATTPNVATLSKVGFFPCTRDAWLHVLQQIADAEINCALESDVVHKVFTFDRLPAVTTADSNSSYAKYEADQYTLVFANCLSQLMKVSMHVRSAMYNLEEDGKSNRRDYLSAGKTVLPRAYFLLSVVYFSIAAAVNLLCEAEDKSYIKRTGSAHGCDVLFYIFSFLKGITLFTLIVLIGTGWSFLKPYLHDKEKKVANIAQVVVDETNPFGQDWVAWKHVFLLVDVVCCCAVLFPIVWSIKNLRDAAKTDGKAAENLMKLSLFRKYYIVVICCIYFTRVVVYALEMISSYKYLWASVVAGELATLAS